MFLIMNAARVAVGAQSLSLASSAYLIVLEYIRTRLQGAHIMRGRGENGAVPIIEHADVRLKPLEMKSIMEGCRALIYDTVRMLDRSRTLRGTDEGRVLEDYSRPFIPLMKEGARRLACPAGLRRRGVRRRLPGRAVQQYYCYARLFLVYEGTNGIQSLDLVGRSLGKAQGALSIRQAELPRTFTGLKDTQVLLSVSGQ